MTFSVHIEGHDNLKDELKSSFENGLVSKIKELVDDVKSGADVTVTRADAITDTTGPVDVLGEPN
jgi:hypothetical protein